MERFSNALYLSSHQFYLYEIGAIVPFYRWRNQRIERLNNLPKVTNTPFPRVKTKWDSAYAALIRCKVPKKCSF